MSDIDTIVGWAKADVLEAADTDEMKRKLVEALKHFRGKRYPWMEVAGSTFSTVAGQSPYVEGAGGVPVGIFQIDSAEHVNGSVYSPIDVVTYHELKEHRRHHGPSERPTKIAFYGGKLWLSPIPAAVATISLDYLFDSLRTSAGTLITTASAGSTTNTFMTDGSNVLRYRMVLEWAMTRGASDPLATRMKLLYDEEHKNLKLQTALKRINNVQARAYI